MIIYTSTLKGESQLYSCMDMLFLMSYFILQEHGVLLCTDSERECLADGISSNIKISLLGALRKS